MVRVVNLIEKFWRW